MKESADEPAWERASTAEPAGDGCTVWRIVAGRHRDHAYDGEGARLFGGRWNPPGLPAVYTSFHLSLAALELLVHADPGEMPDDLVAVPARLPGGLAVEGLRRSALPGDWRTYPAPEEVQRIGARWLGEVSAAALIVPSAVIPRERNLLLNPRHPDFRCLDIGEPEPFSFDPRLWT